MQSYYYRLLDLLQQAGWVQAYKISNGRGRDSITTYYILPAPYDSEAASVEAMIEALIGTFGLNSYIYRVEDVARVFGGHGAPVLEITLPNK